MRASRHNLHRICLVALVGAGLLPCVGAQTPQVRRDQAIILDAASSEVDYANNKYLFRAVTITQGDLRVQADEARATGTDFDNATWEFRGKVRITLPNGALRSDLARVQFRNNLIANARIEGQPAEFEQQRAGQMEPARGRARTIDYDVATHLVTFAQDAWLSDGRNEIRGNELVYHLLDQKVRAQSNASDGSGGIRITIRPSIKPTPPSP
jgi:lipopolysaccharide transport protein LptA